MHTVLGAFVAGILVGQSPILTRHIDEQLRGLIVALFMPVFFGLAGLSANIAVLGRSVDFAAVAAADRDRQPGQIQRRLSRRRVSAA